MEEVTFEDLPDGISDSLGDEVNARFNACKAKINTRQDLQVPTLLNSWVNFGAPHSNAAYYYDRSRVFLQGAVKSGTVATTIFTLPTGYRPPATIRHPVDCNGTYGTLNIESDGDVILSVGSTTNVSLEGVSFRIA